MIVHTLIYDFDRSVSDEDRTAFFTALRDLTLGSGHVEGFGYQPHVRLPVDEHAKGTTGSYIAQYAASDVAELQKFSELPEVADFLRDWHSRISYRATYANHAPIELLGAPVLRHTEHTVTVDAPVDVVWDVVVDVEGYARIFPPTREATILDSSPTHQTVRLVVDVSGEIQTWVSRRDIDAEHRVVAYRQLDLAPLIGYMGGEWRALPVTATTTQLVLTHDFRPKDPVDGLVAGRFTREQADEMLRAAVERNSVADLGAVKAEAERRTA
jgi:ribosome-associated toxin RatA of RatAB toxin-antitoxin module